MTSMPKIGLHKLIYTILTYLASTVLSTCPENCICSSKSVVCTCNDLSWTGTLEGERVLTLSPFTKLEYVDLVIVHTCDRLIIPNDTFTGLQLLSQLKLVSIRLIDIHPYAFRGIQKSPKKFVIQDSNLELVQENAFIGLFNLEHFWWRNVSVGRIETGAFTGLSKINYIYFRNALINRIESGAFSNMRGINNLYMREGIVVSSMGDQVFGGAQIDEVVFENANVRATDLSLTGLFATSLHIFNTAWISEKSPLPKKKYRPPQQSIQEFFMQNSSLNRLLLNLHYNFSTITYDACENIGKILIENSKISHFHSRSIYDTSLDSLEIKNSRIEKMSPKFLEGSSFYGVTLEGSEMGILSKVAFSDTSIEYFTINNSKFLEVQDGGFARIKSKRVQIFKTNFGRFGEYMFNATEVAKLIIHHSKFFSTPPQTFLKHLSADQLEFSYSEFPCHPMDCETNALYFHPSIHTLAWKFEQNQCLTTENVESEDSKVCIAEKEAIQPDGLACRRRVDIEECVCTKETDFVVSPKTDATILVLGDCGMLKMNLIRSMSPNLKFLYLYRISTIEVISLQLDLKLFQVLHSSLYFVHPSSVQRSKFDSIIFSNSIVDKVTPMALSEASITSLVFNHTQVYQIRPNAFFETKIGRMEVYETNFLTVGDLFLTSKRVKIEDSRLHETKNMERIEEICIRNVTFTCRCLDVNFQKILNSCEDILSSCIDEPITSPWSKPTYVHDEKLCTMEVEYEQKLLASTSNFSCSQFSIFIQISIFLQILSFYYMQIFMA